MHLHGLLGEVLRYCTEEDDLSIDRSEYESLDIDTTALYRSKDQHQTAVLTLTEAITDELRDERPVVASPNLA